MKDVNDMNARELRELIETAQERLEVQTQIELTDVRSKIQAIADEAGVDVRELFRRRRKRQEEPEEEVEETV